MKNLILIIALAIFATACKKQTQQQNNNGGVNNVTQQDPSLVGIWLQDSMKDNTSTMIMAGHYIDSNFVTSAWKEKNTNVALNSTTTTSFIWSTSHDTLNQAGIISTYSINGIVFKRNTGTIINYYHRIK